MNTAITSILTEQEIKILCLLNQQGDLTQDDLAAELGTWSSSIDSDLDELEIRLLIDVADYRHEEIPIYTLTAKGKETLQ
ncbi:MAG: MarR family transcriptional regulator [Verrucomicrobiota bacterium]